MILIDLIERIRSFLTENELHKQTVVCLCNSSPKHVANAKYPPNVIKETSQRYLNGMCNANNTKSGLTFLFHVELNELSFVHPNN